MFFFFCSDINCVNSMKWGLHVVLMLCLLLPRRSGNTGNVDNTRN